MPPVEGVGQPPWVRLGGDELRQGGDADLRRDGQKLRHAHKRG